MGLLKSTEAKERARADALASETRAALEREHAQAVSSLQNEAEARFATLQSKHDTLSTLDVKYDALSTELGIAPGDTEKLVERIEEVQAQSKLVLGETEGETEGEAARVGSKELATIQRRVGAWRRRG